MSSLDLALPRPAIGNNTRLHLTVTYYCNSSVKKCSAKRDNRQTSMCCQQLAGPCVFIATTFNSKCQPGGDVILILIDLFYVIPQRRVPYRLRCNLMTKNLNVAAIDSAQFRTWLDSHLWGNFTRRLDVI